MTAKEIHNFVSTAVYEVASDAVEEYGTTGKLFYENWSRKVKELKENPQVTDVVGAFADYLFNDVGTLSDLIGDKIYEAADTKVGREAIIAELSKVARFPAWQETMEILRTQL